MTTTQAAPLVRFAYDPDSTYVVIRVEGPDGTDVMGCIVRHYGHDVVDVRFPAGWRTIVADIGLDAYEVETEEQLVALASEEFARQCAPSGTVRKASPRTVKEVA